MTQRFNKSSRIQHVKSKRSINGPAKDNKKVRISSDLLNFEPQVTQSRCHSASSTLTYQNQSSSNTCKCKRCRNMKSTNTAESCPEPSPELRQKCMNCFRL